MLAGASRLAGGPQEDASRASTGALGSGWLRGSLGSAGKGFGAQPAEVAEGLHGRSVRWTSRACLDCPHPGLLPGSWLRVLSSRFIRVVGVIKGLMLA